MQDTIVSIGRNGRLLIPAAYRRALHLEPGASVVLTIENDRLQVLTLKDFAKNAQARVKELAGKVALSTLLKQERDEDLAHE